MAISSPTRVKNLSLKADQAEKRRTQRIARRDKMDAATEKKVVTLGVRLIFLACLSADKFQCRETCSLAC